MKKIISMVPNICEGRDTQVLDGLVAQLNGVEQLVILDVSRDIDRNRTVLSLTGPKDALFEGGKVLYREALQRIDMRRHQGEYPRLGAVDVVPFVPLHNATIDEAVAWASEFAEQVAAEFNLPVYLYAEAARTPQRSNLEDVRQGEYEGLAEKLKDPSWKPDFGPATFRPEFGATIIGARYPQVSFKIMLNSTDETVAEQLALAVHEAHSGLNHVRAYAGDDFESRNIQLTVVITNYQATPMYKVIEAVRMEARRFGLTVLAVEMIGLVPQMAIIESAAYYMGLSGFTADRLMEKRIQLQLNEMENAR
jgi:glutamate formiminotransferase / 5-formyltetrahydrofolate cyclo-ligase